MGFFVREREKNLQDETLVILGEHLRKMEPNLFNLDNMIVIICRKEQNKNEKRKLSRNNKLN